VGDHPDAPENSGSQLVVRGGTQIQLGESPKTNSSTITIPAYECVLLVYYPNKVIITLIIGEFLGWRLVSIIK
jgi:hypothetical protein